jgi:hypothetical protein
VPLMDLSHADSGRLRTATMDSDCPTGLQFATAAGAVAWPQRQAQPQQQRRTAAGGLGGGGVPCEVHFTGQLSLRTAPERISECGCSVSHGMPDRPIQSAAAANAAATSTQVTSEAVAGVALHLYCFAWHMTQDVLIIRACDADFHTDVHLMAMSHNIA